jgi:molybdopterin-guanine dinucleotide biosynthesis protein A
VGNRAGSNYFVGEVTLMNTGGIVVCGGQSQRMGRPKVWLPFAGEIMLPRIVRLVGEVVSPVVVVAAVGQDLPPLPAEVVVVRDDQPGLGPLQGLVVGLKTLVGRAHAAYVSSCDVPLLRPAFIERMIHLRGSHAACVPQVDGYLHPLAAVYDVAVFHVAEKLLAAHQLRPVFLFEAVPTRFVTAAKLTEIDPKLQSLRNLNTPQDYEMALAEVEGVWP